MKLCIIQKYCLQLNSNDKVKLKGSFFKIIVYSLQTNKKYTHIRNKYDTKGHRYLKDGKDVNFFVFYTLSDI